MQPVLAPVQRPFTLKQNAKYAPVRDVTGKTRSPARGFVTAAVAAREYWPALSLLGRATRVHRARGLPGMNAQTKHSSP